MADIKVDDGWTIVLAYAGQVGAADVPAAALRVLSESAGRRGVESEVRLWDVTPKLEDRLRSSLGRGRKRLAGVAGGRDWLRVTGPTAGEGILATAGQKRMRSDQNARDDTSLRGDGSARGDHSVGGDHGLRGEEVAPGPTITVVFTAERAREARQLALDAHRTGLEVRMIPAGLDLHREAVTHELWSLYELTARLRRECPWDRKQTQEDIVAYTLEETYELADTVRSTEPDKPAKVLGELGDLLFQVYFLACIAEEHGRYDLGEVATGINAKLVRRHPHIFGDACADTPEEVRKTWDAIKKESEGREGIFHDVPYSFPATLLAQKLQQRAAAVGFDWDRPAEVIAKLREEIEEIEAELRPESDSTRVAAELGDLMFAVVNLARKLKVDPELALRGSSLRFRERVEEAARGAGSDGRVFEELALDQQEWYYQLAKGRLASGEAEDRSERPNKEDEES